MTGTNRTDVIVDTTSGRVRGSSEDGLAVFRGIPYGAPTGGANRFRAPRDPEPWTGVRDALEFGPMTMQYVGPRPDDVDESFGGGIWRPRPMGEDCLVLNVWTPATAGPARRPVMVWLHGGAFMGGMGDTDWTPGARLALEHDVVVVHLNHRLNAFGFLHLAGLGGAEYAESGNAGMLDIVAALRWVHDNIAAFGGDAGNVTLFGESGGGWKISTLLAMPVARGLFHKAIVQSGSYLRANTAEFADHVARHVLSILDVPPTRLEMLHEIPGSAIIEATRQPFLPAGTPFAVFASGAGARSRGVPEWNLDFAPVVDGVVLPRDPFDPDAPPGAAGIPMLIGTNRDEVAGLRVTDEDALVTEVERRGLPRDRARDLVAAYSAAQPGASPSDVFGDIETDLSFRFLAILQAERQLATGAPVFMYLFTWEWAAVNDKAVHWVEVPFAFGQVTPELLGTARDESTRQLATAMCAAWAAFARSGNPSHPGLPAWEPYDLDTRATMILGHERHVEHDPRSRQRAAIAAAAAG